MMLTRFLLGYRGILDDGRPRSDRIVKHWKLDPAENFSRMRLRLAPFHNFDSHARASELRDNASTPAAEQAPNQGIDPSVSYHRKHCPDLNHHRESVSRLTHGRNQSEKSMRELERTVPSSDEVFDPNL